MSRGATYPNNRARRGARAAPWARYSAQPTDQKNTEAVERDPATGRRRAYAVSVPQSKTIIAPGEILARRIWSALRRPPRADCLVYDATGALIAVIDGETRERRAVP